MSRIETKSSLDTQAWLILLFAALLFFSSYYAQAQSRMPVAKVSQVDGKPCFSVPDENADGQAVKLYAMSVTTVKNEAKNRHRETVWQFIVSPPGNSLDLSPNACIVYGAAPESSLEIQKALPLRHNKVYAIEISAHPKGGKSPILGYSAEFCIKGSELGVDQVLPILQEKQAGKRLYEICDHI